MGGRGGSSGIGNGWSQGTWSWTRGKSGSAFNSLSPSMQSSFESGVSQLFNQVKRSGQTSEIRPGGDIGFSKVVATKSGNSVVFSVKSGRKTLVSTTNAQKAADAMAEAFRKKYPKR